MNDRIFNTVEEIELLLGSKVEVPVKHIPRSCNIVGFEINDTKFCVFLPNEHFTQSEDFAYLRIGEKIDKFTPDCLLGVETTQGFVTSVDKSWTTGKLFISTTDCSILHVSEAKYYISDDSDEAVSFDEYVKLFYDVEGVL